MKAALHVPATTNNSFSSKDASCHMGSLSTLVPLQPMMWLRAAAAAATVPVPNEPSRTISFSGSIAPHSTAYCALLGECVQANRQRQTDVIVDVTPLNDASARTQSLIASDASTTTYGTDRAAAVSVTKVKPSEEYMHSD